MSRAATQFADDLLLVKLAEVSPHQQETEHTCSAACLKAVLRHYGVDLPEALLSQAIRVSPKYGAEITEIVRAAQELGFSAMLYEFENLDQAKWLLDQDIPIIADIQSFKHPGKGHYVVITKIDGDRVYLMDPNTKDGVNQRVLTREHADARWWDRTMAPPHGLKVKWGAVILPPNGDL